jgi:hypothetical protein
MHEKQVLIYFILDNEGHTAKEAKKLLKAKRKFNFMGLRKVIPRRDRIKIWGTRKKSSSFEEANFTDSEIAMAINMQAKKSIRAKDIGIIRNDLTRGKALIKAVEEKFKFKLNKIQLNVDLIELLIRKRQSNPNIKHKRPVEDFILKSGELILLNHQPTGKEHQKINIETGLLG